MTQQESRGEIMRNVSITNIADSFSLLPLPLLLATKDSLRIVQVNESAARFLSLTDEDASLTLADLFPTEATAYQT